MISGKIAVQSHKSDENHINTIISLTQKFGSVYLQLCEDSNFDCMTWHFCFCFI